MSSSKEKNTKSAGRARALAAWEWFKEAAWLQVLLIVGVVVGLVIAIPFVVEGIVNALNRNDSNFYESHRIKFADFERYLSGEDKNCNGTVGAANANGEYGKSDDQEGFVVMFYKQNDSDCNSLQGRVETWYNNFNKNYGEGNLKFYTIDVSWYTADKDKSTDYEGDKAKYENPFITLDQQQVVIDAIVDTYLDQDEVHKSGSVTETDLRARLDTDRNSRTLETPLFLTYTHKKGETGYKMSNPNKVIFNSVGSLSVTSDTDVARMMLDIYNFQIVLK